MFPRNGDQHIRFLFSLGRTAAHDVQSLGAIVGVPHYPVSVLKSHASFIDPMYEVDSAGAGKN